MSRVRGGGKKGSRRYNEKRDAREEGRTQGFKEGRDLGYDQGFQAGLLDLGYDEGFKAGLLEEKRIRKEAENKNAELFEKQQHNKEAKNIRNRAEAERYRLSQVDLTVRQIPYDKPVSTTYGHKGDIVERASGTNMNSAMRHYNTCRTKCPICDYDMRPYKLQETFVTDEEGNPLFRSENVKNENGKPVIGANGKVLEQLIVDKEGRDIQLYDLKEIAYDEKPPRKDKFGNKIKYYNGCLCLNDASHYFYTYSDVIGPAYEFSSEQMKDAYFKKYVPRATRVLGHSERVAETHIKKDGMFSKSSGYTPAQVVAVNSRTQTQKIACALAEMPARTIKKLTERCNIS